MRNTWGSTITAGITASAAIVVFMIIIPQILGMGMIDITKNIGMAFSESSPHIAGAFFLALIGIFWAAIFSVFYNSLPGSYVTKGALFGVIVGLFSLTVLPNIMTTLDSMFGSPNQYVSTPFVMNLSLTVNLIAYVLFGLVMAWSYRPAESADNS